MSAYSTGRKIARKGVRTARRARRDSRRIGGVLVLVGAAMAVEGHFLGTAGPLSSALAFAGDASAIIGLGFMLRRVSRW